MQISRIVVTAGRTFNHPYEDCSTLRPQVTLEAILADGENISDKINPPALLEDSQSLTVPGVFQSLPFVNDLKLTKGVMRFVKGKGAIQHCAGVRGAAAQLRGAVVLGARVLGIDGGKNEASVRRYIQDQGKEDQRLDQMELRPL